MVKFEHSESYSGLFNDYKDAFVLTNLIKYYDGMESQYRFAYPTMRLCFERRIPNYRRQPSQTIMQGVGKVGGLLAILKLITLLFKWYHQKQFVRELINCQNRSQ